MSKNFHVRQAAVSALNAWANGHDYAETLVERHASRRNLTKQDRALLQAILLGILRHRRLLDHWITLLRRGRLDDDVRDILRVGLCQLFILELPDHAAVNETVECAKASTRGLINAILRKAILQKETFLREKNNLEPPILYSHPEWLFNRWKKQFGLENTIALMQWNNQPAQTFATLNPLRPPTNPPEEWHGEPVPSNPLSFLIKGSLPNELLANGSLYIQDPATHHCINLLNPKPGELILDACAAPGGKSFLIAAKLGSASTLTCTDSNEKRIPRLRENLQRLGYQPAELLTHDWTQPAPTAWHGKFDAILLDVPCSNTGVLRRRVDARWRLQPQHLESLNHTQLAILNNALPCLKLNGRLIYSTCSIDPEENQLLIQRWLTENSDMQLISSTQILPFQHHTDGAFTAKIQRKTLA